MQLFIYIYTRGCARFVCPCECRDGYTVELCWCFRFLVEKLSHETAIAINGTALLRWYRWEYVFSVGGLVYCLRVNLCILWNVDLFSLCCQVYI